MKFKYFKRIKKLAYFNILPELNRMLDENKIAWHPDNGQICINSAKGYEDNVHYGTGSLFYDWDNQEEVLDKDGKTIKLIPKTFKIPKKESDFDTLCTVFENTVFEEVYNTVKQNYQIGRMRLMLMRPKFCLTWHMDDTNRLHYPIQTNKGCQMVIENEVLHMPSNTWWLTDTSVNHTAFNASPNARIHLVTSILGENK
jgi:hypothetical protein